VTPSRTQLRKCRDRARNAVLFIIVILAALIPLDDAKARGGGGPPGTVFGEAEPPPTLPPEETGDLLSRTNLLGDFGGLRSAIAPYGFNLGIVENSEVLSNVTGGEKRGVIYEGVTDLNLGFDLRPYFGWRGVFFARAYQIHGRGLSGNYLANLDTESGLEANRATRLFELWYEQRFGDWLRIRIGEQTADQEFIVSTAAKLFVNGAFGWPTLPSVDLPSGGPGYPLSTPAVRFRVDANDALTFFAGVFNGDPAGPGLGDPQKRDPSGTAFRLNDGAFALSEVRYNPDNSRANGTYRLGAWYNSQPFADQHIDTLGQSLASPLSNGLPRPHHSDTSLYGIVDQPLFKTTDSDAGLTLFARAMGAPQDRNLINLYLDGGVTYKGLFDRPNDTAGLAIGYARIGKSARLLDADTVSVATFPYPIRSAETVVELTYEIQLTPWCQLQPDFQYVFNPGGNVPNPLNPQKRIGDAAIFGLRTQITF
jgi:porin